MQVDVADKGQNCLELLVLVGVKGNGGENDSDVNCLRGLTTWVVVPRMTEVAELGVPGE